jgi:hypothetical protein
VTPRTPRPPKETHFVLWDDPGHRSARALCGRIVYRTEHSKDPSCHDCAKALITREKRPLP